MPIRRAPQGRGPDARTAVASIFDETGEQICEVDVTGWDTIRDVKDKIAAQIDRPVEQQELRHQERIMDENVSLAPLLSSGDLQLVLIQGEASKMQALRHVRSGGSLVDLSVEMRNDPDVVLIAASEDVCELQYASEQLRSDPDFMAMCVAAKTSAMYYTAVDMWDDARFVRKCVEHDGMLLQSASEELRSDVEIVKLACEVSAHALQFATPPLRDDKDIVLAAVSQKGTALKWASPRLKNDRDVVLTAVRNHKVAYVHASRALKDDPEVEEAKEQQRGDIVARPRSKPSSVIKHRFKRLDKNGDGFLDLEELEDLLRAGNPDIAQWELQLLFEAVDKSKDGRVEFEEFVDFVFPEGEGLRPRAGS